MRVSKGIFEDFVRTTIASLPERFIAKMDNVSVIVTDRPSAMIWLIRAFVLTI